MAEAAVKLQERKRVLSPERFKGAEYERVTYFCVPPEGDTLEDVCKPEYWAHLAGRLRPADHIEVFPDGQEYWAHLLVVAVQSHAALVQVISHVQIGANVLAEKLLPAEHIIKWAGAHARYRVVRLADGAVLKDKLPTKEAAAKYLQEYLVTIRQ